LIDSRFTFHDPPVGNDYKFFSAGNLVPNKKFDLLIKSFCDSFDKNENVFLRIAGFGKEYENLKKIIYIYGRENQIKLLGRLSRDEILKEFINSNCFVLPSEYETFGIVYREAMAVGRPVISTRNGGVEEGWDDKFGILVPKNNAMLLSEAMKIMKERRDYDYKYISNKCTELYSFDSVGSKIDEILKKAVLSG
jgi:glycosyltransferase involved in cell wall biosynthesis